LSYHSKFENTIPEHGIKINMGRCNGKNISEFSEILPICCKSSKTKRHIETQKGLKLDPCIHFDEIKYTFAGTTM